MAPVLQCPDCGTKHPIASVPDAPAFACTGCGRALKVPASVPRAAAAPVAAAAPEPAPPAAAAPISQPTPIVEPEVQKTAAMPVVDPGEPAGPADAAPAPPTPIDRSYRTVPWWARLLLWIVAVPLSFFIVFIIARGLGVFTSSELSDVFLASDSSRFWPVARLLPFVALLTAGFVQGGVLLLARRRGTH